MGFQQNPDYTDDVTIANSGTTSTQIDLKDKTLLGLFMPSAFTGTAITFLASQASGGTDVTVTDGAGADYSITVAPSKYVPVDPNKFLGVRFLKVKSGSTELAARTVGIASRRW